MRGYRVFYTLSAGALLWACGVQANYEQVVQSVRGSYLYMLVYESDKGTSERKPGVYLWRGPEKWEMLFEGTLLASKRRSGVDAYLPADLRGLARDEAMAVVNGKILVFHSKSKKAKPASFAVLGSKEHPILHPLTKEKIVLPPLTAANQVSVFAWNEQIFAEGYHGLIAVSVDLGTGGLGSGVTFAFTVEMAQPEGTELVLGMEPVLLDTKALDAAALAKLFVPGRDGVRSPLLERMLVLDQEYDPSDVKEWRRLLAAYCRDPKKKQKNADSLPYLQIPCAQPEIRIVPSRHFSFNSADVVAAFDPFKGAHGFFISDENELSLSDIHNKMSALPYAFDSEMPTFEFGPIGDVATAVFVPTYGGEGAYYGFVEAEGELNILRLPLFDAMSDGAIKSISMHMVEDNDESALLFTSVRLDTREEETRVHRFRKYGERVELVQSLRLSDGYIPQAELSRRIELDSNEILVKLPALTFVKATKKDSKEGEEEEEQEEELEEEEDDPPAKSSQSEPDEKRRSILIDLVTPTGRDYEKRKKRTSVRIDVQASLEREEPAKLFLTPDEQHLLAKGLLYRIFPTLREMDRATGLYLQAPGGYAPLLHGEIVQHKRNIEDSLPLATTKTSERGPNDPIYEIDAFLIDTAFEKGRSTEMAFWIHSDKGHRILAQLGDLRFNKQSFVNFFLLPPKKNWSWDKPTPPTAIGVLVLKSRTLVISIPLEELEKKKKPQIAPKFWTLATKPLGRTDIVERIRYVNNSPFFILTPELESDSVDFKIANGQTGESIFINRDLGKKIVFDADGSADMPEGFGLVNAYALTQWTAREKRFAALFSRVRNAMEYRRDMFSDFRELLEDLGKVGTTPRKIVYLVPPELLAYVRDYPFAVFARGESNGAVWSDRNKNLVLSVLDPEVKDQETILDTLASMREINELETKSTVLVGSLADVWNVERPSSDNIRQAFRLKDYSILDKALPIPMNQPETLTQVAAAEAARVALNPATAPKPGEENEDELDEDEDQEGRRPHTLHQMPHLLYLLATEGNRVQPAKFAKHNSKLLSMLLIGTEEEWKGILADASVEERWGLSEKFEVISLSSSSSTMRRKLILEILNLPELTKMGYQVDVSEIVREGKMPTEEQARRIMATHIDQWVESLALQTKQHVFVSLMRFLNILAEELSLNTEFRNGKVINRAVLGRTLAKVFPIPMSLVWLPKTDPLWQLKDPDFIIRWDQAGYRGEPALKKLVIETVLSQLDSTTAKTVPASALIYGPTGTGKTRLLTSLFSALGLKYYDFDVEDGNENSDVFFLDMNRFSQVDLEKESRGQLLDVKEAIEHFHKFLLGPKGAQGWIVLDDFHAAPDAVREAFLRILRQITNEPYYRINGQLIPTRNLRKFITLNPTDDQKRIRAYASDTKKGATEKEVILATLNTPGQNIFDSSSLARIGRLIKIGTFSTSAKPLALADQVRLELRNQFSVDGRFSILTEPTVLDIVRNFPDTQSRAFLSSAAHALTRHSQDELAEGRVGERLTIVVPRSVLKDARNNKGSSWDKEEEEFEVGGSGEEADIARYVEGQIVRFSLRAPEGRFFFLTYLADNFRKKTLDVLYRSLTQSKTITRVQDSPEFWGQAISRGIHDHFRTQPELPWTLLNLNLTKLTGDPGAKSEMSSIAKALTEQQSTRLRKLPAVGELPAGWTLPPEWGQEGVHHASRQAVLRKATDSLTSVLGRMARSWAFLGQQAQPDVETWLKSIPNEEVDLIGAYEKEFNQIFWEYIREVFSPDFAKGDGKRPELTQYDAVRLFSMALDRALGQIDWAGLTVHFIHALEMMTGDLTYGGERGVQRLLFDGKSSPLLYADRGILAQTLRNYPHFGDTKTLKDNPAHSRFMRKCKDLLLDARTEP